ncbi:hypothetical protein [Clostridium lacusfryxellense]|uniref:hypothetical protein n=1 Tax=Clostridium lacusfryxellense TaxID=205328 RepID=UPI001C0C2678|nr:hypothetical protein [Clostridium lacusfryxellense]MBU3110194.1 hypothetical protein [Clostridium lacusfryxellense]
MKNKKISLILISVSMTTLIFTGCAMKNSTKTPMNNTNKTNQTNQTNKSNQATSTDTMKKLYSNALNELVTAKTITTTQSKKVLAAITKNMPQGSVANSSNRTTTNTGTGTGTGTTGTPEMTGTPGTTGSTGTAGTGTGTPGITGTDTTNETNQNETTNDSNVINELRSLVSSKVITQGQSDMIYQKIHL